MFGNKCKLLHVKTFTFLQAGWAEKSHHLMQIQCRWKNSITKYEEQKISLNLNIHYSLAQCHCQRWLYPLTISFFLKSIFSTWKFSNLPLPPLHARKWLCLRDSCRTRLKPSWLNSLTHACSSLRFWSKFVDLDKARQKNARINEMQELGFNRIAWFPTRNKKYCHPNFHDFMKRII